MVPSSCLQLNTGGQMPSVGYGTWQANGQELEDALNLALEHGYRHIDTATAYGNEEIIGKVIEKWISSGRVKREELFIVTKLPGSGNSSEGVDKFVAESLEKLKLKYIDLYLIHVPFGFKEGGDLHPFDDDGNILLDLTTNHMAVWTALERHYKSGVLKAIGLSNFNQEQIEKIYVNGEIKPANLQIEVHVLHQQKELIQYCAEKGIVVTAYSPLGTRGISDLLAAVGSSKEVPNLLEIPQVRRIAESLGKSPAQVLLRFLLEKGVAVIPKSTSEAHIKSNIQVNNFELDEDCIKVLEDLDKGRAGRIVDFTFFKGAEQHPEFPFRNLL